jgi:hypothetical protein
MVRGQFQFFYRRTTKKMAKMRGNFIFSRKATGGVNTTEKSRAKDRGTKTTRAK